MENPETAFDLFVELMEEPEGGYSAIAGNLPGVVSQGETKTEAMSNIYEAACGVIESYLSDGKPIPWKVPYRMTRTAVLMPMRCLLGPDGKPELWIPYAGFPVK